MLHFHRNFIAFRSFKFPVNKVSKASLAEQPPRIVSAGRTVRACRGARGPREPAGTDHLLAAMLMEEIENRDWPKPQS